MGAATVRALAAAGWAVLATDHCADDPALPYRLGRRDELDQLVACAGAARPDSVQGMVVDVRDPAAMAAAVAAAERRWGGLDAAGAGGGGIAGGGPLGGVPAPGLGAGP